MVMTLARSAGPSGPVSPRPAAAPSDWPAESPALARQAAGSAATAERDSAISPAEMKQLTDRVVAVIDRRLTAGRERMGG